MKESKAYAAINKGKIINVIEWDGTWYDAQTNPRGMMRDHQIFDKDGKEYSLADCTLVDVSVRKDPDNFAEPGGTYDSAAGTFTRAPEIVPTPLTEKQVALSATTQQVVQALIDKGLITPEDLASSQAA